jgi:hypothetical protein
MRFTPVQDGGVWPAIRPVEVSRTFDISKPGDTPFRLLIENRAGAPAYKLECHNGDYDDMSGMSYSGDFQCALFALGPNGERVSWNLFATDEKEERSSDWYNRARMIAGELYGACGENPDYGRVRRFRFRGMAITFWFENLVWQTGGVRGHRLAAFTFRLRVVNDRLALTPVANRVAAPRPSSACYR